MVTELIFELLAKTENEPSMKIEISKPFIPLYTRTWFMHALFDLAAVCFALQGRSLSFTGYQVAYAVWGMYSTDASRLCKCCTRGSQKIQKEGQKKFWRERSIAPNPQHMAIAQYHSKDGWFQFFLTKSQKKRRARPSRPPSKSANVAGYSFASCLLRKQLKFRLFSIFMPSFTHFRICFFGTADNHQNNSNQNYRYSLSAARSPG